MNKGALKDKLQMLNQMLSEDNDMIMKFIGEGDTFKNVPMGDTGNPVDVEKAASHEHSHFTTPQENAPVGYASLPDDDN